MPWSGLLDVCRILLRRPFTFRSEDKDCKFGSTQLQDMRCQNSVRSIPSPVVRVQPVIRAQGPNREGWWPGSRRSASWNLRAPGLPFTLTTPGLLVAGDGLPDLSAALIGESLAGKMQMFARMLYSKSLALWCRYVALSGSNRIASA